MFFHRVSDIHFFRLAFYFTLFGQMYDSVHGPSFNLAVDVPTIESKPCWASLGERVVSFGRVWVLLFYSRSGRLQYCQVFSPALKRPVLVWTNSAQMLRICLQSALVVLGGLLRACH